MLTLGAFLQKNMMVKGSCWELQVGVNGYANFDGDELLTQAKSGRNFQLIDDFVKEGTKFLIPKRIKVRLMEDGYLCWLEFAEVENNSFLKKFWEPKLLTYNQISERIPNILNWLEQASNIPNKYLWGGTIGPNFDCSGLVQTAFALEDIWLPRDAYQQENFCLNVVFSDDNFHELIPGDLLFFGNHERCNHVAIYKGQGLYWHSSGVSNGRNGIGVDGLFAEPENSIAAFYNSSLRSVGRVVRCHDGTTLP